MKKLTIQTITPEQRAKLALEIAGDWNFGYTFENFVSDFAKELHSGAIKCYWNDKTQCCEYNQEHRAILLYYTQEDVNTFGELEASNKKYFKNAVHIFGSVENYYKNLCLIHEYGHSFISDWIAMTNPARVKLLEDYMLSAAKEDPVDRGWLEASPDPRLCCLLDALDAFPIHLIDEAEKTIPFWRLQEVLAYWFELVYAHPFMSSTNKIAIQKAMPRKLFNCLQKVFKFNSYDDVVSERLAELNHNKKKGGD